MLSEMLGINDGDVLSITGSGGKTTALVKLGAQLRGRRKTLVTSTTKIGAGQISDWDFRFVGLPVAEIITAAKEYGLYFAMKKELKRERKFLGFDGKELDRLAGCFDIVLSEADGARGKLLKGWGVNEPVVAEATTKVMGIINLRAVGERISDKNIHRPEEFCKLTHSAAGDRISPEMIREVILNPQGLFKDSGSALRKKPEKILFINMIDGESDRSSVEKFLELLASDFNFFDTIVYGSLLNENYTKVGKL